MFDVLDEVEYDDQGCEICYFGFFVLVVINVDDMDYVISVIVCCR